MGIYLGGIKIGLDFALEPEWTYILVVLYSGFYGNLKHKQTFCLTKINFLLKRKVDNF